MKSLALPSAAVVLLVSASPLAAQQLNWGSEIGSSLVDSTGAVLDHTFVFELGTFASGFTPAVGNVDDWAANWLVFDQASYNSGLGYFTSTVLMEDDGTSDSPFATLGAPSFEGLDAFLWIRNDDDPVEGSEWLLTRADSWVFPNAIPGCCDNGVPIEWSVSDLEIANVPVWGNQDGIEGAGAYTTTGGYTLQTYTFVPEPGSLLLTVMAGCLALRRKRNDGCR